MIDLLAKPEYLITYIRREFGPYHAFAKHLGISSSQVTKWIEEDYMILDGVILKPLFKYRISK